ncbi:MFS transporter [Actinophytocola sp.]|uniref:MFS transporter n=1 Tax=Actinophytocola sp. TaxID=1872138 RepID=UPI003899C1D2
MTSTATRAPAQGHGLLARLAAATAVGSTGLAAGGTAGALLATDLAGPAAAGLPLGLLVLGSAAGAVLMSWLAARGHRRRGLVLGYTLGVAGAALVVLAAVARSLPLVLVGSVALGTANSAVFLTRYAAAAATTAANRGRALGTVFFATAIGAVASPLLLGPSEAVARHLGLPRFSGLYLVAVLVFGAAALVLATGARSSRGGPVGQGSGRAALRAVLSRGRGRVAVLMLAGTNLVMTGVMTIAPVHLVAHGQGLDLLGTIVALHVLGMFAPSPVSGRLADRFGPLPVILAGAVLLLAACLLGLFAAGHGTVAMVGHLLVLGVGWNFGIVGASTLLAGAAPEPLRPYAEGIGEMSMGLAAAVAGPAAGLAADLGGYWALSLGGAVAAVCLLAVYWSSNGRTSS